jgi:hypothetical protein
MVVAALISYLAPSNRGFIRSKESDDVLLDSFHVHDHEGLNQIQENSGGRPPPPRQQPVTRLRRKPLRAMAVLTSFASDFDVICDWLFYYQTVTNDKKYREEFTENPQEGQLPYLIPRH